MEYLDLSHTGAHPTDLSLHKDTFAALRKRLADALNDHHYKTPYHFVSFLTDTVLVAKAQAIAKLWDTPELRTVFIVGIGGANLVSEAMIKAFPRPQGREFIFLDTLYAGERDDIVGYITALRHPKECAVVVVSKSGTTIETLSNTEMLVGLLEERLGTMSSQIAVLSEEGTPLMQWAKHRRIHTIAMPAMISDRFAAFSPISLLPLLLARISIEDFIKGGLKALEMNIVGENHPAFNTVHALQKFIAYEKRIIVDFFFFSKRLEVFGKWHRQLFAESLGKSADIFGKMNPYSLTPTVSVGTTDLHSVLQLYLAEPKGRFAWFLRVQGEAQRSLVENRSVNAFLTHLSGNTPEHTVGAIYESIVDEYDRHHIPFIETSIDAIKEESMGFIMMNAYVTTLGLSELWNVDAFSQPEVESYKARTRALLQDERIPRKVPLTVSKRS